MARYPDLPILFDYELGVSPDSKKVYNKVEQWGAALVNELDTRDTQMETKPSTNIYTVTTITLVGNPNKGDIAYSASTGKFKGYVSTTATQAWENLN